MSPSRRTVLAGGLGVLVTAAAGLGSLESGLLPRRSRLPADVPTTDPGRLFSGSFVSTNRHGRETAWSVAYPPGHDGERLPVLITLHGRGGSHRDSFAGSLHLDRFLAAAVRNGSAPFAIASVDGGDHEYWHPRRDSDPAGRSMSFCRC